MVSAVRKSEAASRKRGSKSRCVLSSIVVVVGDGVDTYALKVYIRGTSQKYVDLLSRI